jgi:intein/homing endonuclease
MQVLMADGGQKSISSVEAGDLVRSHDGSVRRVAKKFERDAKERMLKMRVSGVCTGTLRCTVGHELLTERDGEVKFVQAGELKVGDFLLTPCSYSDTPGTAIQSELDFAWLLGVYAAEGCGIPYEHVSKDGKFTSKYKGVYFCLSFEERDSFAAEIKNKLSRTYGSNGITITSQEDSGGSKVSAYGTGLADDLCGSCPGMSSDGSKRLSPHVMRWSNDKLTCLLAGFMSGDGCFNKSNGFQGVGVSKKLCEQIANICDKLGIEYSFTQGRAGDNWQVCYNVRISRRACGLLEGLTSKPCSSVVDENHARNIP